MNKSVTFKHLLIILVILILVIAAWYYFIAMPSNARAKNLVTGGGINSDNLIQPNK